MTYMQIFLLIEFYEDISESIFGEGSESVFKYQIDAA